MCSVILFLLESSQWNLVVHTCERSRHRWESSHWWELKRVYLFTFWRYTHKCIHWEKAEILEISKISEFLDFWCFFVSKTVIEWKCAFLGFGGRNTKFKLQTEWVRLNDQYFIGKEFTCMESWFYIILCFFAPKTVIFGLADVGHQNFLGRKIDFFRFLKNVF